MSWLGRQTIEYHSPPASLELPIRSDEADKRETRSLLELTKQTTPPCVLNPLLFNGHLQTFYTLARHYEIPIHYKRRIFTATSPEHPGTFGVDFVVPTPAMPEDDDTLPPRTTYYTDAQFAALGSDDEKPMLIALHGLAGGSNELYLRALLQPLVLSPPESERWEACIVTARGCAKTPVTGGNLTSAASTWDSRQIMRWAREKWPRRRLFACGLSMGANILVNGLAEEGAASPIDVAIALCNPWNLEICNVFLSTSAMGMLYSRSMGDSMLQLYLNNKDILLKECPGLDEQKAATVKYLIEFDRHVQCPAWGYPTEGIYYRQASSVNSLLDVKVPLLIVHAKDDPFVNDLAAPYEEVKRSPFALMLTTSGGGHLSWFEPGGGRWFARQSAAWLNEMARVVDFDALRQAKKEAASSNGMVKTGAAS